MKKKENKQLSFTIIAVLLLIAIIGGSTYAYWSWQTDTNQQTLVDVTVRGGTLTIVGTNVTNTSTSSVTGGTQVSYSLYPTDVSIGCDPSINPAVLKGSATVTATNYTGTPMLVTLLLKASLTTAQGSLTTTNKEYLKWAVVETTDGIAGTGATSAKACTKASGAVTASGTFKDVGISTDIATGITWTAYKNNETATHPELTITTDATNGNAAVTKRTYDVYVWIDKNYTFTNTGTSVTDPMQDLTVTMTWSTNSTMAQIAG